ncbi:hypothetical protein FNU76_08170 [Chitinimonas arctica]|uniref:Uncharacterized protein n=1 Tax=Chitinimonas arctica TaxID=2594795 RepID=A0A516SDW2_9NEIS|nr:hypothetical protein [Chitinimonas arctica]QDQ26339.1 hypothetical protein FNU76_08170 [Chitinimonas arctica]
MYHTPNYRHRGTRRWVDQLRGMLGKRVKRQLPEPGPRPNIGDYIAYRDLIMKISEPVAEDLWSWLVFVRWRQVYPARDRRQYRRLPSESFRRFARAETDQRDAIMLQLLRQHRAADTIMGAPR